jgi:hypothetical protein
VTAVAADLLEVEVVDVACPTVTKTTFNQWCHKDCDADCQITTTVSNACGCPREVPTATRVAPCNAPCPFNGCGVDVVS